VPAQLEFQRHEVASGVARAVNEVTSRASAKPSVLDISASCFSNVTTPEDDHALPAKKVDEPTTLDDVIFDRLVRGHGLGHVLHQPHRGFAHGAAAASDHLEQGDCIDSMTPWHRAERWQGQMGGCSPLQGQMGGAAAGQTGEHS
jgi:hypothetical protein